MKLPITALLTFIFAFTSAQETIVPLEDQLIYPTNGDTPLYYKDVNSVLDKYVGTWIFNDGTHDLKLIISKKNHVSRARPGYNDPNFEDLLSVSMIYKLNGTEIYNTTTVPLSSTLITGNIIQSTNKVTLSYEEPTSSCRRSQRADLTLTFVPSSSGIGTPQLLPPGTLEWERINTMSRTHASTKCFDGTPVDATDFKIPTSLVLARE